MQKGHADMGMGELEYTPLMSYLTRTLSAMYAIVGAICFYMAYDVKRYLMLIRLLGCIAVIGGIGVTILDTLLHLPWLWTALEGPMTMVLGIVLISLARALYAREDAQRA
jgi:hypothetical protein